MIRKSHFIWFFLGLLTYATLLKAENISQIKNYGDLTCGRVKQLQYLDNSISFGISQSSWKRILSRMEFLNELRRVIRINKEAWESDCNVDEKTRQAHIKWFGTEEWVDCVNKNLRQNDVIWFYDEDADNALKEDISGTFTSGLLIVRNNKIIFRFELNRVYLDGTESRDFQAKGGKIKNNKGEIVPY